MPEEMDALVANNGVPTASAFGAVGASLHAVASNAAAANADKLVIVVRMRMESSLFGESARFGPHQEVGSNRRNRLSALRLLRRLLHAIWPARNNSVFGA